MAENTDPRNKDQQDTRRDQTASAKKAAPRKAQKPDLGPDGIRHFQGSMLKRNADGEEVMSDHLEEGDEIANAQPEDEDDN